MRMSFYDVRAACRTANQIVRPSGIPTQHRTSCSDVIVQLHSEPSTIVRFRTSRMTFLNAQDIPNLARVTAGHVNFAWTRVSPSVIAYFLSRQPLLTMILITVGVMQILANIDNILYERSWIPWQPVLLTNLSDYRYPFTIAKPAHDCNT